MKETETMRLGCIRFTMYRKIRVIISILAIVESIEIPNKVWVSPESGIVMEPETSISLR